MATTKAQKIQAFLRDNRGKKIDANSMHELFFGPMEGTTIERKGRSFYLVKYLLTHKKYGNRFEVLCTDCGKGTFECYVQNLKDSAGRCKACQEKMKKNHAPRNKGTKKSDAPKKQETKRNDAPKKQETKRNDAPKKQETKQGVNGRGSINRMTHVGIPEGLRGTWKEYSEEEYQKKLLELNKNLKFPGS